MNNYIRVSVRNFLNLALSITPELVVLISLLGFYEQVNMANIFIGYFVGVFWFTIASSVALEINSKKRKRLHKTKKSDELSKYFVLLQISAWLAFIVVTFEIQRFVETIPKEILLSVLFFSAVSIARSIIGIVLSSSYGSKELEYFQAKIYHDGVIKLILGMIGILLVYTLPSLNPDIFGYLGGTVQTLIFCAVFTMFIIQNIWFWYIEEKVNVEQRKKKIDRITKCIFLVIFVFWIFIMVLSD